jgi:hypothetical protein
MGMAFERKEDVLTLLMLLESEARKIVGFDADAELLAVAAGMDLDAGIVDRQAEGGGVSDVIALFPVVRVLRPQHRREKREG